MKKIYSINRLKIAPALKALAVSIDSLRPDPNNANEHPADNLAAIKESLERVGQLKPIVATEDGIIRAGNGTWLAAKEMGATSIAVVKIPKELEDQAEAYAISDNQTTRMSKFNATKLKEAVERLRAKGTMPEELGFNAEKLQGLIGKMKAASTETWSKGKPAKLVHSCPNCGHKFGKPHD